MAKRLETDKKMRALYWIFNAFTFIRFISIQPDVCGYNMHIARTNDKKETIVHDIKTLITQKNLVPCQGLWFGLGRTCSMAGLDGIGKLFNAFIGRHSLANAH
jgi:hypothetical protein